MTIQIVRLGSPRNRAEGLRIGTVRRPPRGVKKEDYAKLDYYDVWLPQIAPSAELVKWIKSRTGWSSADWLQFEKQYRKELSTPDNLRLLELLAALSGSANFSVGCYCEDETKCHRSALRTILAEHGAKFK
jgi:uncharacterized protein YeaO (DUF488 family)